MIRIPKNTFIFPYNFRMEFLILDHCEGDEPLKRNESIEVDEDQYITLGTDSVEIQAGFENFRISILVSRNFQISSKIV